MLSLLHILYILAGGGGREYFFTIYWWIQTALRHFWKCVTPFVNIYLVFSSARLSKVPKWFPVDAEALFSIESLYKNTAVNTLSLSVIFFVLDPVDCSIMSKFFCWVWGFSEYQKHSLRI